MACSRETYPPFAVAVQRDGGVATVVVGGELDLATVPRLSATVAEHGDARLLVLDLTAVTRPVGAGCSRTIPFPPPSACGERHRTDDAATPQAHSPRRLGARHSGRRALRRRRLGETRALAREPPGGWRPGQGVDVGHGFCALPAPMDEDHP
jgi:hypothetical protein